MSSEGDREIVWLTELQVRILHAEVINLFGGAHGIRDEGLLQSALARPQNLYAYDKDATLFDLATSYVLASPRITLSWTAINASPFWQFAHFSSGTDSASVLMKSEL